MKKIWYTVESMRDRDRGRASQTLDGSNIRPTLYVSSFTSKDQFRNFKKTFTDFIQLRTIQNNNDLRSVAVIIHGCNFLFMEMFKSQVNSSARIVRWKQMFHSDGCYNIPSSLCGPKCYYSYPLCLFFAAPGYAAGWCVSLPSFSLLHP